MIGFSRYLPWFFAVVFTLIFTKCNQPYCEENGNIELNAGFYKIENSVLSDTLVDSVSVILGANFDSIYFEELKSKTQTLSFPLSVTSDTSKVIIQFDQLVSDTITIICNRDLRMISHECGFVFFFDITTIETTTNKIDSVRVIKELIEYGIKENIKICI